MKTKLAALLLLAASHVAYADSYDPATNQLAIPAITLFNGASYNNVVVTVGSVVSVNTGTAGSADAYDPVTNILTIPGITVAGTTYSNVRITVGAVLTATLAPAKASWIPGASDTWQLQLRGTLDTGYAVKVYDIDLFDTPQATIDTLKAQGKHVVCYFSAGSSENWRSDFNRFAASDMGNDLSGWPGERWLDTRSSNVRAIMRTRFDLAKTKGCDGVDPDNVDGYANNSGLALNASTQLDYNSFLSAEAHARGLAVGLKNDINQIDALASKFDFAVNEQCFHNGECGAYTAFTGSGKPVFNVEYAAQYQQNTNGARDALCQSARAANIHTLVLPLMLDDTLRYTCDLSSAAANPSASMKLVSRGVPAFSSASATPASYANDADYLTIWRSAGTVSAAAPAWLAYDLSGVAAEDIQKIHVAWYNTDTPTFDHAMNPAAFCCLGLAKSLPGDYTIEGNAAAGGGTPPTSGWTTLLTVANNTFHSRQHAINFSGYRWIRMSITRVDGSAGNTDVGINLDVHSAKNGSSDSWLFLGDSITEGGMLTDDAGGGAPGLKSLATMINSGNATSIPPDAAGNLFNFAGNPAFFPAMEGGGAIGATMWDALDATDPAYGGKPRIDVWLANFPGRYVCLSYGSNDVSTGISNDTASVDAAYANFQQLINKVIAAGKIPCIPKMPWANKADIQSNGPLLNAKIDLLYAQFPQIIHGPDLFSLFDKHRALISADDNLHPNAEGYRAYRQAWADALLKNVYLNATP